MAEPPGPVAVAVYVVDWLGVTVEVPCAATLPSSGVTLTEVAFVADQRKFTDWPWLIFVREASSVTVGCAGGIAAGGAAGG